MATHGAALYNCNYLSERGNVHKLIEKYPKYTLITPIKGSVAHGVRATAGLITGAAAIMIAVFSGFAMGQLVMMQQFGLGLAVAVLLDATVIRVVLVPASMSLLGNANWYLPKWLEWLPRVDVEGSHFSKEPVGVPATPPVPDPAS